MFIKNSSQLFKIFSNPIGLTPWAPPWCPHGGGGHIPPHWLCDTSYKMRAEVVQCVLRWKLGHCLVHHYSFYGRRAVCLRQWLLLLA